MDGKKIKLNAMLGGYFTGNLPESAAVCSFAVDKAEEDSAVFDTDINDGNDDSDDFFFDEE